MSGGFGFAVGFGSHIGLALKNSVEIGGVGVAHGFGNG